MTIRRAPVIWILDDETQRLRALRALLQVAYPHAAVTTASSAESIMRETRFREPPDLFISDIRMEGEGDFGGVTAVQNFRTKYPDAPVLIYSGWPEIAHQRLGQLPNLTVVERNSPNEFMSLVNSILTAQGLEQAVALHSDSESDLVPRVSRLTGRGWVVGGFAAGAAAWSATVLGVLPAMSKLDTILALSLATAGGASIGLGRTSHVAKGALVSAGTMIVILATIVFPLFLGNP